MITIYMGKSAAGKDYLLRKDLSAGKKPIISYTTRPMREKEVDGKDYHFIDKDTFLKYISQEKFVEYRTYNTLVNGVPDIWYYGAPFVNPDEDEYVTVLDVDGTKDFIKTYGPNKINVIYVFVDDETRKERAFRRGSFDITEWDRRKADDDIKFSDERLKEVEDLLGRALTRYNNR